MTASGEIAVSPAVRVYLSGAVPRGCRSRAQSLTSRTELRRMGRSREALNRLPARLCSRAAGLGPASRRNRLISHSIAGDGLQKLHTLCRPAGKVVRGTESFAGLLKFPGVSGPREGWNPKLKLIRESCLPPTRGCRVSDGRSLYIRFLATSTTFVPEGDEPPALPLLRPGRSLNEVTPRG
jgi:hypothetical protein